MVNNKCLGMKLTFKNRATQVRIYSFKITGTWSAQVLHKLPCLALLYSDICTKNTSLTTISPKVSMCTTVGSCLVSTSMGCLHNEMIFYRSFHRFYKIWRLKLRLQHFFFFVIRNLWYSMIFILLEIWFTYFPNIFNYSNSPTDILLIYHRAIRNGITVFQTFRIGCNRK